MSFTLAFSYDFLYGTHTKAFPLDGPDHPSPT
jgi:hypothetical protein